MHIESCCLFANAGHMLTESYVEALLVDEELADLVWYMWNAGMISSELAAWAWWLVSTL